MSDTSRSQAFAEALRQLEQGDDSTLLAMFTDDAELRRPEQDHLGAVEDADTFWKQYRDQFQDLSTTFERLVDAGDEGILEWHSSGTLRSGRHIDYAGVSLLTFTADKVSRFATYYDTAAFSHLTD